MYSKHYPNIINYIVYIVNNMILNKYTDSICHILVNIYMKNMIYELYI